MTYCRKSVVVKEMEASVRIGCFPEERASPQRVVLSLRIELGPQGDWGGVELDATVDYSRVVEVLRRKLEGQEWVLVEHAAAAMAETVLGEFQAAETVEIEIRKFIVPACAWTGVELKVQRQA